eukprot:29677-Pelagococcus_subviridis.AAC.2
MIDSRHPGGGSSNPGNHDVSGASVSAKNTTTPASPSNSELGRSASRLLSTACFAQYRANRFARASDLASLVTRPQPFRKTPLRQTTSAVLHRGEWYARAGATHGPGCEIACASTGANPPAPWHHCTSFDGAADDADDGRLPSWSCLDVSDDSASRTRDHGGGPGPVGVVVGLEGFEGDGWNASNARGGAPSPSPSPSPSPVPIPARPQHPPGAAHPKTFSHCINVSAIPAVPWHAPRYCFPCQTNARPLPTPSRPASVAEGRSIQANVGVELKGVSRS